MSVVTLMRCLVCLGHLSHWFYICCVFTLITIFSERDALFLGQLIAKFLFFVYSDSTWIFRHFFLFFPFFSFYLCRRLIKIIYNAFRILFKYTHAIYKDKRQKMNLEIYIFNTLSLDSQKLDRRCLCFWFSVDIFLWTDFCFRLIWFDAVQNKLSGFYGLVVGNFILCLFVTFVFSLMPTLYMTQ